MPVAAVLWELWQLTHAWEQRKLKNEVEFFHGLTYKPSDRQDKGTLVLRSSNIQNNQIVDADNVYVNSAMVNSDNVELDDIIVVVRNGSRDLIGKHAQVIENMPHTVIGAFMTGIRSEHNDFINALLSTDKFQNELYKNMGATINQITGYMFANMKFSFPVVKEQDAIGALIKLFDKLLALQQRKLRYLKCLTKALRQQMFVKREHQQPQLRFAKFNRRWNVCKIEELLDYKRPDKYIVKNTNYSDSGTPVLTANKSFILGYSTENNIYNKLPVIIFDDFTLENKFVDFPFLVKSSAIKILLAKKHFSTRFIYELLQHTSFINEGHARHYISVVQKTKVSIPTKVEEQNKIADNFSKIEKLCKFQQNKIDELTSLKKSLLQKIFI